MADGQERMNEDHENDSEDKSDDDENTDNDSEEDIGQPLKRIRDFVRDPQEQDVTLHVKVVKVGQVEEKSNKNQFMATVADDTSAVDICVREENLFDKFELEKCIILRNVTWNGKVLFTKSSSTATFAAEIQAPENIIADAFGEGEPVPISEITKQDFLTKISLKGKIVKQTPLIKRKCYGKVLSYRKVKLEDETGSVDVDVWGDIAEQMQLGKVYKVISCKKRKPRMPHDPWVTTTPTSTVMLLPS
ncbi:uncharacterized protein LOC124253073 [Haliotis rubra]|uniref:uncharacterized protein LOC124253073 n=1 Tax=Haliotis rubra TaxID=36100 RepID=UPI001EE5B2AA|nr:uncharacterized protein LOC124253073 [Haliotis rubra]